MTMRSLSTILQLICLLSWIPKTAIGGVMRNHEDPAAECVGQRLHSGERLYQNQHICDAWGTYQFGLDENGVLADRFSRDGEIIWTPPGQPRGTYLHLQKNGNLVLIQENATTGKRTAAWASYCYGDGAILMRSGSTYPGLYTVRADRITERNVAPRQDMIWLVNHHEAEPDTVCTPAVKCVGNRLTAGITLQRDEYICPLGVDGKPSGEGYRFGVSNNERLVLAFGRKVIYDLGKGNILKMKDDGTAVLNDKQNNDVWSTKCNKEGNFLEIGMDAVYFRDKNGTQVWFLGFDKQESQECGEEYVPTGQCDAVTLDKHGSCRLRMIDHLNLNYVELEAKGIKKGSFEILDGVRGYCGQDPWVVRARLESGVDMNIDIDGGGVPDITCSKLISRYKVPLNNTQLDFLPVEGCPCTEFGQNLIWFLVVQMFYFG